MAWQNAVACAKLGIAGNAFGQPDAMLHRQILEKFLRAFVGVKHPQLQIQHRLARDAEQKMSRLDDARVNRADGHLKNALAFDGAELVALALKRRQLRPQIKILAQRMHLRPVVVQRAAARVRMADQFQAEQILHFAFLPVDAGNGVRERGKLRFVRRHRHAQDDEAVRRVERENVVKMKRAVRLAARRRRTGSRAALPGSGKDAR